MWPYFLIEEPVFTKLWKIDLFSRFLPFMLSFIDPRLSLDALDLFLWNTLFKGHCSPTTTHQDQKNSPSFMRKK